MKRGDPDVPWWMAGGPEACPFCLGRYWLEVEVRCVACDRPVCPACTVHVRTGRRVFCPECDAGAPAGPAPPPRSGDGEGS